MKNCLDFRMLNHAAPVPSPFWTKEISYYTKLILNVIYWFNADSVTTSPFRKRSEVLETIALKFWNKNNHSEVLNLKSKFHVINLKEPLVNNSEGKLGRSCLFVDAYRQDHTKVYNIILSFLVWAAPEILWAKVNVLVFGLH